MPPFLKSTAYYTKMQTLTFENTKDFFMEALYNLFIPFIPRDGHILDGGCGSGRDALHFKNLGYKVTAFDGSKKMAKIAEAHTGLNVMTADFENVDFPALVFDGIWTAASLLHVQKNKLPSVLKVLKTTLKPKGIWFMSFREGDGESFENDRYFNDQTIQSLTKVIQLVGGFEIMFIGVKNSLRSRRGYSFVSAVMRKTP